MKKLIYGNWKMNLTAAASAKLATSVAGHRWPESIEVAVFPSLTALDAAGRALGRITPAKLGAQDCFWEEKGAFTGEVSPSQLKELGCSRVLVGHSERRRYMGETDEMINRKVKAAKAAGLLPVLCVGESDADRRNGNWPSIIERQVTAGLQDIQVAGTDLVVIAYEPTWAIGTGRPCDPPAAGEAHALIRSTLTEIFGPSASQNNFAVIYGGSVDADNIASFLRQEGIDGALVGGASQSPEGFGALIDAASAA